MRRRAILFAGLLSAVVAAVTLAPGSAPAAVESTSLKSTAATTSPATATGSAPTATDEAFRHNIATYLSALGDALNAAAANPALATHVKDYQAAIDQAKAQVPNLTAGQLEAAETILGQHPGWATQPNALKNAIVAPTVHPAAIPSPFPGFLSDCVVITGGARNSFNQYWDAAQVASAANAVASGIPDGANFAPLLVVFGVAFGVANGIAITYQMNLNKSVDCVQATFNGTLETTYPTDSSVSGFTRASSQISVDALAAIAGNVQMTLDNIQTLINGITSKLAAVINSLGVAQGTANTLQATVNDLKNRTDALLATVGTSSDTGTTTANGLANTINGRMDTILANTATFQTLSVRMQIERDLAAANSPVVALFALPASQGGYLETVRDIVATTIGNEVAAGQGIGQAQVLLSRGNTAFAANQFEAAFVQYALAYKVAVQ